MFFPLSFSVTWRLSRISDFILQAMVVLRAECRKSPGEILQAPIIARKRIQRTARRPNSSAVISPRSVHRAPQADCERGKGRWGCSCVTGECPPDVLHLTDYSEMWKNRAENLAIGKGSLRKWRLRLRQQHHNSSLHWSLLINE